MGVRSSQDLVRHAEPTVAYIMAGDDKVATPRKPAAKKVKDEDNEPTQE